MQCMYYTYKFVCTYLYCPCVFIWFQILLPSRELKGKLRQEAEDPYRVCVRPCVCVCVSKLKIMVFHRSFSDPLQHTDQANSNLVGQL